MKHGEEYGSNEFSLLISYEDLNRRCELLDR